MRPGPSDRCRHHLVWALATALVLTLAGLPAETRAQPFVFTQIAIEFNDGLWFLNADVRPALADDGMVVFGGYDMFSSEKLFSGNGGPLTTIHIDTGGYSNVQNVAVNSLGSVAWVSDRQGAVLYRGVYFTQTSGTFLFFLHEGPAAYD
ncbi:MAG: hypothetical protein JRG96_18770, partial [Deltaproteobacteria bacterium]|nr:hypothetical protein [Deltaproteobacteria bacterium]